MKEKIVNILISIKNTLIQFGGLTAVIIPIFVFVNWAIFSIVEAQKETIQTNLYTSADNEVNHIDLFVNTKLSAVYDDIEVVINSDEASRYLLDPNSENTDEFEALLYRITSNKPSFFSVMLAEPDGDVLYHIDRIDGNLEEMTGDLGNMSSAYYFSIISHMNLDKMFVSQIHYVDNKPIIAFVKPLVYNNDINSFLVIEYDVNDFLSVLGLYNTDVDTYFDFGLINNGVIWVISQETYTLSVNNDLAFREQLLERIVEQNYVKNYYYSYTDQNENFYVEDMNDLIFYVLMDYDKALQDSESVFLKNPALIAIITNLFAGILITFIGYMIRLRRDDRLLINANMYLSVENSDSICIIDKYHRIVYVNPAFEKMFSLQYKDVYLKKTTEVIKVPFLPMKKDLVENMKDYKGHVWSRGSKGINLMNYMQIKKESSMVGHDVHYIGIYSPPKLDIDDYRYYETHKEDTIYELNRLFSLRPFLEDETTLFLLEIEQVDVIDFGNFLAKNINRKYDVCVLINNHIMIYANIKEKMLQKEMMHIDNLIETYRYQQKQSRELSHALAITRASKDIYNSGLLLGAAITTLSYAKAHKDVRYHISTEKIINRVVYQNQISKEISNGFSEHEFYLEYQVLKSLENHQLIGVEALLRWKNHDLGFISPADFIPVIEQSTFVSKLTLMVLSIAIFDFEKIMDSLDPDFRISINLIPYDLSNEHIIDQMLFKINQSDLKPSQFVFEIKESQYINNMDRMNRMIQKLHEHGVLVAVDNFGTGYSSLNLLQSIHVDLVKLDRSYIEHSTSKYEGEVTDALVRLIHRFQLPIVAEGIETKEQIEYCLKNKIHYAQGYFIARPLLIDDFTNTFITKPKKK